MGRDRVAELGRAPLRDMPKNAGRIDDVGKEQRLRAKSPGPHLVLGTLEPNLQQCRMYESVDLTLNERKRKRVKLKIS
jgi:hypothetical protein